MARIAGKFNDVKAWSGIPGRKVEDVYAAVLVELGVPQVYRKKDQYGDLSWYAPRAFSYLATTENIPFFLWVAKHHTGGELDGILRLSSDPFAFIQTMMQAWADARPDFVTEAVRKKIALDMDDTDGS